MDELLAEIERRADDRWGDGAYEGPYARQEIMEGIREIVAGIRAQADACLCIEDGGGGVIRDRCPVHRDAPDYCNVCENFPCMGGHPPAD